MTTAVLKRRNKTSFQFALSVSCTLLMLLSIGFSKYVKDGILNGARLALTTIIPTLFPFFILSDLWLSVFKTNSKGLPVRCFENIFRISGNGLSAFFLGSVFGFPLGVKIASNLYNKNRLSKDETERLIGFINNPSAAYIISGIGIGLLGDIKIGVLLYISVISSAIIIGIILKGNSKQISEPADNTEQSFNFVDSIKNAAFSSITILSYIVFFSGVCGLVFALCRNELFTTFLAPLLEVSTAINRIVNHVGFPTQFKLSFISFALGFSGFSVHFQAFSFLPSEISKRRYLLSKFAQGLISFIITFLFSYWI